MHCGLCIGGRLGFLESGGAIGLTSGHLERTTSMSCCCWQSLNKIGGLVVSCIVELARRSSLKLCVCMFVLVHFVRLVWDLGGNDPRVRMCIYRLLFVCL